MPVRLFHRPHTLSAAQLVARYPRLATMEQVHRAEVHLLQSPASQTARGADALISPFPETALAVRHADCLPIFISHPNGIKAAIHAGRRSTQLGILGKVLHLLKENWHLHSDLQLYFGPHICGRCYQIDPVTNQHFDLRAHNLQQLHSLLAPNQFSLQEHGACTLEHPDLYSYRQSGKGVAMNWSVVE